MLKSQRASKTHILILVAPVISSYFLHAREIPRQNFAGSCVMSTGETNN